MTLGILISYKLRLNIVYATNVTKEQWSLFINLSEGFSNIFFYLDLYFALTYVALVYVEIVLGRHYVSFHFSSIQLLYFYQQNYVISGNCDS